MNTLKKQAFNPYLPFSEYIPDGEPHVFGNRVYLYGSHDKEGGTRFCPLDYVVYSAPIDDLSDWRYEGISYRATQDPGYGIEGIHLYAPDVMQGSDGRYYLYYALAAMQFTAPIHVAVSDSPAGPFEYYGFVKHPDGSVLTQNITFDPGVLNDNGRFWLYYGWSLTFSPEQVQTGNPQWEQELLATQVKLFGKTEEEIRNTPNGIMGANVVELEADMLTIKSQPKRIVHGIVDAKGTSFEGHAFFEANSMRKINGKYYFIYSSQWCHELCYAISSYPDHDFVFAGTLVSNGDIGINDRKPEDCVATTGNNHGSVEYINGQWYVFYHRHTHARQCCRQGCAEPITLLPDGHFVQAEMTSCGLNGKPLRTEGNYSAMIACHLTNGHMPPSDKVLEQADAPYLTNEDDLRFATNLCDGSRIGFKYFQFDGEVSFSVCTRGTAEGLLHVRSDQEEFGVLTLSPSDTWETTTISFPAFGAKAIYLDYQGIGTFDLLEIAFATKESLA